MGKLENYYNFKHLVTNLNKRRRMEEKDYLGKYNGKTKIPFN